MKGRRRIVSFEFRRARTTTRSSISHGLLMEFQQQEGASSIHMHQMLRGSLTYGDDVFHDIVIAVIHVDAVGFQSSDQCQK